MFLLILSAGLQAAGQAVPGSMEVQWSPGAADCRETSWDPLQVHMYEPRTFIIRQDLCVHHEANFIYLLVGSERALLVDTGVEADTREMPLAQTVLELLPEQGDSTLPLIVAHSHGHRDHRAGDPQFDSLRSVRVVPPDLDEVRFFFGFENWPNDAARLDLGDRWVHAIPSPGHHPAHLVFYDERTNVLLSGDFLLPGRLLIDDLSAYRESARRVVDYLENRPVAYVLGSHLELDVDGQLYPFRSQHRPDQRRLELSKEDLAALLPALENFNGFYSTHESFVLTNPTRNLLAMGVGILLTLALVAWGLIRFVNRKSPST